MKIVFYFLIAVTVLSLANLFSSDEAMTQCQQKHSYDTCFQLFNR